MKRLLSYKTLSLDVIAKQHMLSIMHEVYMPLDLIADVNKVSN